ncbi:MAG TPA: ABC transporter substrate-binding protein [Pseudonocardiaceae bacterium]|nr:ABC transporter substrate-binding protein [Pseudonocardiaceae bacterium]
MRTATLLSSGGHRLAALAVGGICALALAACGSSASSAGGDQSVTVAIPPVVSGVDVYVAQEQGFFSRHHLTVSVKVLNGGAAIVPAMESGAVDIGETNVVSVIQGASHNIAEPCFTGANTDPSTGAYLSLVTSKGSGVTTAAGLRGRTVAVNATNGVNQLLVQAYLDAHGVSPTSVHFISLQYADMPQALNSNRVAAAVTSEPFTTISVGNGNHLLTGNPLQSVPGTPTYSCWNASAKWLSDNHTAAADYAAAMSDTDAWIAANPAKFRTIAAKHLTIAPATLAKITLPVFTAELSQQDITAWETVAHKYGLIPSSPKNSDVLSPVSAGS